MCGRPPIVGRPWAYLAWPIRRQRDAYTTTEPAALVVAGLSLALGHTFSSGLPISGRPVLRVRTPTSLHSYVSPRLLLLPPPSPLLSTFQWLSVLRYRSAVTQPHVTRPLRNLLSYGLKGLPTASKRR